MVKVDTGSKLDQQRNSDGWNLHVELELFLEQPGMVLKHQSEEECT